MSAPTPPVQLEYHLSLWIRGTIRVVTPCPMLRFCLGSLASRRGDAQNRTRRHEHEHCEAAQGGVHRLLTGANGADGITWVLTRPVRPTKTPFVGAYVHKDKRGPINRSIFDHGDFYLYCVASSEWDKLAPHVSSGWLKCDPTIFILFSG